MDTCLRRYEGTSKNEREKATPCVPLVEKNKWDKKELRRFRELIRISDPSTELRERK